ncbi:MAG: aminotransferase class V-fold PLP-dependent enzyme [Candidatus Neomarinimicrobiota bacterium]|tara:strand:- start:879 stop:2081 length:1203 start_codon:yes stop_codon:yes gene_type:complete
MSFSPQVEKKNFPIFDKSDLIYLDNAATTHKPSIVLDTVNKLYKEANANVHRAIYDLGNKSTKLYEDSRKKVSDFINAYSEKEIIFTSGTTESLNLLAYSLSKTLKKDDEILISEMEHHSNIVPWQLIAKNTGAKLTYIPVNKAGELDLTNHEDYFKSNTKIVSITHISNVLGTINPIKLLAKMAHKVGALFIVDGAQGVPHMNVDIREINCDFYVFSGHKMLAPTGIGILWGKYDLLNDMEPFMGGGEMIDKVTLKDSTWNEVPYKFEAGTPNFAQAVGLGAAIDYLNSVGIQSISEHESELTQYALTKLKKINNIKIHGESAKRGGVISFNIKGVHSHDLAQFLNEENIAIRVGHHCAQPLLDNLGETSTARISFYLYNYESDVEKFCKALTKIQTYF